MIHTVCTRAIPRTDQRHSVIGRYIGGVLPLAMGDHVGQSRELGVEARHELFSLLFKTRE